jgi:hypothetical protein
MTHADKPHRQPRRKRGGLWLGAALVTIIALSLASLLYPYVAPPPVPNFPEPRRSLLTRPPATPVVTPAAESATAPAATAPRPRRRGVPLDASARPAGEDYQVLSAEELDRISQARH